MRCSRPAIASLLHSEHLAGRVAELGSLRLAGQPYTVLREIALLRYKSPTLVVRDDRLTQLDHDLVCLAESGVSHPQIAALREICAKAVSDGCALTVSGDMYPELWRTNG